VFEGLLELMNPIEPQDPLWKLLGKGRSVDVRSNFVQNVVREARQTPQERGFWAAVKGFWTDSIGMISVGRMVAGAAAVVVLGVLGLNVLKVPSVEDSSSVAALAVTNTPAAVEAPLVPEVETQLESLDYLDELLALEDTSALSDREIAYLLY
jgi:hypothetical protein